jgi:alpha-glucosidase
VKKKAVIFIILGLALSLGSFILVKYLGLPKGIPQPGQNILGNQTDQRESHSPYTPTGSEDDLKHYRIPTVPNDGELIYKAPKRFKNVSIRYSGNDFGLGKPLRQNTADKLLNRWRIPISELGYKEGRHRFKFLHDGNFEPGFDRVAYVDKEGNWYRPPSGRAKIEYRAKSSKKLTIKDDSSSFIEGIGLGGDWDTKEPLVYNTNLGLWELDISELGLQSGYTTFKLIKNGEIERGANRIILVQGNRVQAPTAPYPEPETTLAPKKELSVLAPTTTYLAIRGSFDNWEKEHELNSGPKNTYLLNPKDLNLTEGKYYIKFITSEGEETNNEFTIFVDESQNISYKGVNRPSILPERTPDNKIIVSAPDLIKLQFSWSQDDWKTQTPLNLIEDGLFEFSLNLDGVEPGVYSFKFLPNGQWEPGEDRRIIISPEKTIEFPSDINPKIKKIDGKNLLIEAPSYVDLELKTYYPEEKTIKAIYSPSKNLWEVDGAELGVKANSRTLFQYQIGGEAPSEPYKYININQKGKVDLGQLEITKPQVVDTAPLETEKNPAFGNIRKIDPNPTLSLKGAPNWENEMTIYHIWVKSFRDSSSGDLSNDRIGDLRGIREVLRTGYFNKLGINTLWLSPIFGSRGELTPSIEMHGYDSTDNYRINTNYGTLEEFQALLNDAHSQNIRVLLDIIPNHVSIDHPWFQASRDPTHPNHSKYKDYFVWFDTPPNKWKTKTSWGEGTMHYDPKRSQYYYSNFGPMLPDLNFRNPEVQKEFVNLLIYWMNMGVDGVRIDAIVHTVEPREDESHKERNHPDNITFFQNLHRTLKKYESKGYPKVLLAENYTWDRKEIELYGVNERGQAIDSSINFEFGQALKRSLEQGRAQALIGHLTKGQPKNTIYTRFLTNHDSATGPRPTTAYGEEGAKLAAMLNILLPGPYIIYYGEELGMEGTNNINEELRQPLKWSKLKEQEASKTSFIATYITLKNLRTKLGATLKWENMTVLETNKGGVLALLFQGGEQSFVCIYNFGKRDTDVQISLGTNLPKKPSNVQIIFSTKTSSPATASLGQEKLDLNVKNIGSREAIVISIQ